MTRKKIKKLVSLLLILIVSISGFLTPFYSMGIIQDDVALANSEAVDLDRPGYHFTPPAGWMNDPNGLVYFEGEYHLFYQHNPTEEKWGPMYWGHAVSKDLINWEHLPVALFPDEQGFMWSGSVVVDYGNTSGFGTVSKPAMVAIFTQEKAGHQIQSLAYSVDKGRSWEVYDGNPVIEMPEGLDVFRDPKVFWHDETEQWVMVISAGDRVHIYNSADLKEWKFASEFGSGVGSHDGTWECPDLIALPVDGDPGRKKWVLTISLSEGAPAGGSGMQYFVGDFNGTSFTNDNSGDEVLWVDHGSDFYAAVTWGNIPENDGHAVWLGWMNNWRYGQEIPATSFRGSNTLPREVRLKQTAEGIRLIQNPVREVRQLRSGSERIANSMIKPGQTLSPEIKGEQLEIIAEFEAASEPVTEFGLKVRKGETGETKIGYDVGRNQLFVDRSESGMSEFHSGFAANHEAAMNPVNNTIKMHVFLDKSSVEVFGNDGMAVITDQIFPDSDNLALEVYAEGGEVTLKSMEIYELQNASISSNVDSVEADAASLPTEPENPDFETGDLSGWTETGSAFDNPVSSVETFWGGPFNHQGKYHVWGFAGAKNDGDSDFRTGVLKSGLFKLGGSGKVDFLVGGGQDINKLYIALIRASDGKELFKATGSNTEAYRRITWNASEYLGEALYFKVVDLHSGGFGHINIDDIQVLNEESALLTDLENPGFESGDLKGWSIVEGEAFNELDVTTDKDWGWSGPFNHKGDYHLWGVKDGSDSQTGILKSNHFTLSGNGEIDFLIGGGNDIDNLYVALVRAADGKELMKATNTEWKDSEAYSRVKWDASNHLGEELYIKVVDKATGGWGHINVDDFNVKNTGLIASWGFDEGKGTKTKDALKGIEDSVSYVFTDAKFKPSSEPLWREGIKNSALLFDGYSTWVTRSADQVIKPDEEMAIEAWVAPRSYEWGDLGQLSAIVNQHNKTASEGYILGMGRHGKWSFQASINGEWKEVWAKENKPLEKEKWSYIVAIYSKAAQKMKLYLNGELVGETDTPKGSITPATSDLLIGKHNTGALINGVFTANMFNGMIDELKMYNHSLSEDQVKEKYNMYLNSFEEGNHPIPDLAPDRSRYDGDRYRPQYHFIAPEHWMNEPHAPIFYNGKYHLFYQNNPQGPYWHQIHWGHSVSDDMVHWEDAPIALAPEGDSVSPDGVWSGGSTVDAEGNPVLLFTAGDDKKFPNQMTGLARSADPEDPYLEDWIMHDTPVTVQEPNLPAEEGEVWYGQFRDPFVWKDGDTWYQLVGSGIKNVGGTALLYTSKDLINWKYEKPLMVGNYGDNPKTGQVWELPVFLPLGKGKDGKDKYAFFINPWFDGYSPHNVKYVWYWIGSWDKESLEFIPDHEDPRMFDYGEHFTGPSGMVDENGRSILFSIAQDRRTEQQHYDAGWAHNAGLPIELSLNDEGDLGIKPITELKSLRKKELVSIKNKKTDKANLELKDIKGDMLEIELEMKLASAEKAGLKVRKSADGKEETLLFFDAEEQTLNIDRTKSTLDPDIQKGIQGGNLKIGKDHLTLHIYLDRSMIEAYANGKKSLTSRVYPTLADSLGLQLWSSGGTAIVKSMKVWELGSAYGESVPAYWPEPTEENPSIPESKELTNHDFQTGNLTGWIAEGEAFSDSHVTKALDWGWGGPFNQSSDRIDPERYHLWGFNGSKGGDALTGTLQSEDFVLGGDGMIDFLVGGGANLDRLYIALVRSTDDKVLFKATGGNYEGYHRMYWDASEHIGEELYIKVVDYETGGWGHINIDDVNVPVEIEK
ncbi:GH32 C-terminal domain-containing protein [Mesobacillus subterraneus]|uniref:GH32 C-terminal domain-containing protein n=1 Tax=Mesobacillus subterraneus TaxID=285983 RepID=UPI00203D0081|nr:GH32 C-terminal domain-containing protein [Mesobacillus subterraneus]MCM3575593.1 GH32 C-terminal domain-containing protein [Mesobacillus subterraneus]